jgi:putative membrane protein
MKSALLLSASVVLATLASAEPSLRQAGNSSAKPANAVDRQFANTAAKDGQAEVEMSELALSKGTDRVRSLAQRIQADHEKANSELQALAGRKQITLDTDLNPEHRQAHQKLSGLSDEEFDRAYLDQMLQDHKKSIADFERYTREGNDPELKAFAEKSLPTLQAHLKLTQAARAGDGNGNR